MKIALTGATGFIGRYLVEQLLSGGNSLRCWYRPTSDRSGLPTDDPRLEWILGDLGDVVATEALVQGCEAVVHAALYRPGEGFRGGEGDLRLFAEKNILGSLDLMEQARQAGVRRFVQISTCAVHEVILEDRPLDETHPTYAQSHYGAHKAALEQFVYSYGLGQGWEICGLRPTGVYGVDHPPQGSKWFSLVEQIVQGGPVEVQGGGKEVHAADVARATSLLLHAPAAEITGQVFNCYDRYISRHEVATLAKELSGSESAIAGEPKSPKHEIVTEKIGRLGMEFGGRPLLEKTVAALVEHARQAAGSSK